MMHRARYWLRYAAALALCLLIILFDRNDKPCKK